MTTWAPPAPPSLRSRVHKFLSRRTRFARRMRLRRAEAFNAKVQFRMLADRRPELTVFADRVAVRAFVERRVGTAHLTELYGVADTATDASALALPREYVAKANHGSGAVLIVADLPGAADAMPPPGAGWSRTIVRPSAVTAEGLERLCREWLELRYSPDAAEWAYTRVPPRVVFEEVLVGDDGQPPLDYKFFVFDGVPHLVQVDLHRYTNHVRNLYTLDWERLDVGYLYPTTTEVVPRPARLDEMLDVAARLGRGIDFIRVDLYALADRVAFGELTNYPEGGFGTFSPASFDAELGRHWTVDIRRPVDDARPAG